MLFCSGTGLYAIAHLLRINTIRNDQILESDEFIG